MSAPKRLTPALQQQIIKALEVGNFEEVAAGRAGISRSLYFRWKQRGRILKEQLDYGLSPALLTDEDRRYVDFVDAIYAALHEAEATLVGNLIAAALEPKHWRAALELLRIRWPQRYNPDSPAFGRNGHAGPGDLPVADLTRVIANEAEAFQQFRAAGARWLRSMVTQGLTDPAQLPPAMRAQLEHLAPSERTVHARAYGEITFWATARASRVRSGRAVALLPPIAATARATRVRYGRAYGEIVFFGWARGRVTRAGDDK